MTAHQSPARRAWPTAALLTALLAGCSGGVAGETTTTAAPSSQIRETTTSTPTTPSPTTPTPTAGTSTPGTSGSTASATPTSTAPAPSIDADLDSWLHALDTVHPDAFHAVDRATFVAALDGLRRQLPRLSPAKALVAVMRVAALLSRERDGHQFALPLDDLAVPALPLQLYEFDEGLMITAGRGRYAELAGSRIEAVNGRPIAQVLAALEPLVPRDGPATLPTFRPGFLLRTLVLRGLGIIPDVDGPVTLTVSHEGIRRTVELEPIPLSDHVAWAGEFGVLRLPADPRLRYLSRLDEDMSVEYLAPERTVYLRITQIRSNPTAIGEARRLLERPGVIRLVVDIRQNPGGNNHNNPTVLALLNDAFAKPGMAVAVITDRLTFSAAANLATDIEQETRAVFVGEPMGGGLNFWNDVRFIDLEALPTPMMIGVSTVYWQRAAAGDPRLTIEPDVRVPVLAADFFAGRDPALSAALRVRPIS